MDRLEQILQHAAEEVRQVTKDLRPGETGERRLLSPAGWLAFAVAFGVVVLAIGILPSLLGSNEGPVGNISPVVAPSTTVATTILTTPTVVCSATGVERPAEPGGVPDQVLDVWIGVVEAALACDYATLVALAGDGFTTSFGGGGSEMFEEWENAGEGKLGLLLELLGADWAEQTFEGEAAEALGSDTLYVWPAAFARDTWASITPDEMAQLAEIYTGEELSELERFGSYAGWRTGITEEGDWVFFVAGD